MIRFLFCCFLTAGFSLGLQVDQSPPAVFKKEDDEVKLFCTHEKSDYRMMLWYQKSPGETALKLIGYGYVDFKDDGVEEPFRKDFKLAGDLTSDKKNGSLSIVNLKAREHTATYFCAASHNDYNPAYFGKGTKLTVLETGSEVKPPTVTIFPPSPNECRNQKDKKLRKKTLVCVASGFYPDHVGVVWKINGNEAKDGVATDSAATRVDKFYRITSRLRVPAKDYHTASNTFTCIVNFYDGNDTIPYDNSTYGIEGKAEGGITREKYLKVTQGAKLSYVVVIIKSCFYGVFVAFLVWKLQGSARKHH